MKGRGCAGSDHGNNGAKKQVYDGKKGASDATRKLLCATMKKWMNDQCSATKEPYSIVEICKDGSCDNEEAWCLTGKSQKERD